MFFDLSWSHILLLLIITLVVVGPKDLPKMMRMAGQWMGRARAMANQLRKSFDEMARQSELEELRAEINALRQDRPLSGVEQSLHQSILPPVDLAPPPENVSTNVSAPAGQPELMTATPPEHDEKS
jgi:sec-independent protein translocase protein TatB